MGPKGGYFLKNGAEERVFLNEWSGGVYFLGPRGGYFLKCGSEERDLLRNEVEMREFL